MDDLSKRIQPEWQWLSKHNLDHPSTAFSAAHDLIDIRVSKVSSDSIFHFITTPFVRIGGTKDQLAGRYQKPFKCEQEDSLE